MASCWIGSPAATARRYLSPSDLIGGQGPTPSDLLEDRNIVGGDLKGTRSSTTHGAVPKAGLVETVQLIIRLEFPAYFAPYPLDISSWPE